MSPKFYRTRAIVSAFCWDVPFLFRPYVAFEPTSPSFLQLQFLGCNDDRIAHWNDRDDLPFFKMAHGPDLLRDSQLTPGFNFRCDRPSCLHLTPPYYSSEFRISEFRKKCNGNIRKRGDRAQGEVGRYVTYLDFETEIRKKWKEYRF